MKGQNILLSLKLSSQIGSWVIIVIIIIIIIIINNDNGSAKDLELQICICHLYCNWSSWDY